MSTAAAADGGKGNEGGRSSDHGEGGGEAAPFYLHLPVEDEGSGKSKRAQPSKDWWQRVVLPSALTFIHSHLTAGRRVLICCERGDDRSVTVAAAALLALFGPDAQTQRNPGAACTHSRPNICKEDVRARLALIQGEYPPARVSRGLTKELNNFFVSPTGGWRLLDFGVAHQ